MMSQHQKDIARRIGHRVAELRKQRGWSQEKLAREIEMSRETVRAVEAGHRLAEWPTLERIAKALGLKLEGLVGPVFAERFTASKLTAQSAAA